MTKSATPDSMTDDFAALLRTGSTGTGGVGFEPDTKGESVFGRMCVLLKSPDDICGSSIGATGVRICGDTACSTVSHRNKGIAVDRKPGLYIREKEGSNVLRAEPFLSLAKVPDNMLDTWLGSSRGPSEWRKDFAILESESESAKFTMQDLTEKRAFSEFAAVHKTPKGKRKADEHLSDYELVRSVKKPTSAERLDWESGSLPTSLVDFVMGLSDSVETLNVNYPLLQSRVVSDDTERCVRIDEINSRLIQLEALVGNKLDTESEVTLWSAIGSIRERYLTLKKKAFDIQAETKKLLDPTYLKDMLKADWPKHAQGTELEALRKLVEYRTLTLAKAQASTTQKLDEVDSACKSTAQELSQLHSKTNSGTSGLGATTDPNAIWAATLAGTTPGVTEQTSSGNSTTFSASRDYIDLENRIKLLERFLHSNQGVNPSLNVVKRSGNPTDDGVTVEIGGMAFGGEPDVHAWLVSKFPSNDLPAFGVFCDCHCVLDRILLEYNAGVGIKEDTDLQKLGLTPDEALTLGTFRNNRPRMFGQASSTSGSSKHKTHLPALPSKEAWENKSKLGGLRQVLERQLPLVKRQVLHSINARLGAIPEAAQLAISCLEISASFIRDLMAFISETTLDLELSHFPKDDTWLLVTKLVDRIFATELDQVRSFMRGGAAYKWDANKSLDPLKVASNAIWAVLLTVHETQKYQLHGIANHPAISAEYVRFLVANSGTGQVATLKTELESVKSELKSTKSQLAEAVKVAKAAQAAVTTTANKLDKLSKFAHDKLD